MSRKLSVVWALAGTALLPVGGCRRATESPPDRPTAEVTLHVPDMVERQGLT